MEWIEYDWLVREKKMKNTKQIGCYDYVLVNFWKNSLLLSNYTGNEVNKEKKKSSESSKVFQ